MFAGYIREIDSVGRVVVPMQYRKELGIVSKGSIVEMFCDGKQIVMKKATPNCIFCSSEEELVLFEGKYICKGCLEKIKNAE